MQHLDRLLFVPKNTNISGGGKKNSFFINRIKWQLRLTPLHFLTHKHDKKKYFKKRVGRQKETLANWKTTKIQNNKHVFLFSFFKKFKTLKRRLIRVKLQVPLLVYHLNFSEKSASHLLFRFWEFKMRQHKKNINNVLLSLLHSPSFNVIVTSTKFNL